MRKMGHQSNYCFSKRGKGMAPRYNQVKMNSTNYSLDLVPLNQTWLPLHRRRGYYKEIKMGTIKYKRSTID